MSDEFLWYISLYQATMAQADSRAEADVRQMKPRAVSFAFLKGGTSKTTLSVNTARHLAERNDKGSTLLIDIDPNGHATRNFDFGRENLYEQGTDLDKVLIGSEASINPREVAIETPFKFDLIPSSNQHEIVEGQLESEMGGSSRLRTRIIDELLGSEYDYIIIDQPSDAGMMNNNGAFASRNLLLPMLPKAETIESFERTKDRLITPLEEKNIDMNILALVPNLLGDRIDQQTNDRELLEAINTSDNLKHLVPEFARISPEEWEKIDNGTVTPPKPGIRESADITNGMKKEGLPLLDYAPENEQNDHFDALARIIEEGGPRQ